MLGSLPPPCSGWNSNENERGQFEPNVHSPDFLLRSYLVAKVVIIVNNNDHYPVPIMGQALGKYHFAYS